MIVITKIYQPSVGTKQMIESFERHGYEVGVLSGPHKGNGETLRELYECYKRAATGHEYLLYSDGADTFCQRVFEVPEDHILISAEKNCYPHSEVAKQYPPCRSPWKYVNGGGYCGPAKLLIEFFERYKLTDHPNDASGQQEIMMAYLQAIKDGFPVKLDTECNLFQTTAFAEEGDLSVEDGWICNNKTQTIPAIIHANGLTKTPEDWPFKIW
jgi:hypothetical protein